VSVQKPKVKRLSNLDVSNVIVKNKLCSRIDLLAFAKSAFNKGDKGLCEFILNRGDKKVRSRLNVALLMCRT